MTHEPTEPVDNKDIDIDDVFTNPQVLAEIMNSNPDDDSDEALLKSEAVKKIVVPEGLATAAMLEADHLLGSTKEIVDSLKTKAHIIGELVQGTDPSLREVEDSLPGAKRAISELRDIVSDRRGFDRDAASNRLRALGLIADAYPKSRRRLKEDKDAIAHYTHQMATASEEGVGLSKKAFKNISGLERAAEESPESMYFEGVEEKVAARGEGNATDHNSSCEKDINYADKLCGVLSNRFGELENSVKGLAGIVRLEHASDALPSATQVVDSIDQLRSYIYRFEQYGPEFSRSVMHVIDDVELVIRRLETGLRGVSEDSRRSRTAVDMLDGSIKSIEAAITR